MSRRFPVRLRAPAAGALGLLVLFLLTVVAGGSASAHATVVATRPTDGSVVHGSVRTVAVTFDEGVGVNGQSLRVYAPDGSLVATGPVRHPAGPTVSLSLPAGLAHGTYTVAWQVVSADSHPVSGAFTFSLGHPSRHVSPGAVSQRPREGLAVGYAVVRGIAFLGWIVLAGAGALVLLCWPGGRRDGPVWRLIWAGWITTMVAALAALLLQGPYGVDAGFGQTFSASLLHQTLTSRIGNCLLGRIALLLIAGLLIALRDLSDTRRFRVALALAWCATGVATALTWSLAGHASTGSDVGLALASDTAHLSAAALWLGGVLALVLVVLRPRGDAASWTQTGGELARWRAVTRFSGVATGAVLVIVVSGVYEAWRNVGSWAALFHTGYGGLLVAKASLLLAVLGLAVLSRYLMGDRLLRPPPRSPDDAAVRATLARMRRSVTAEACAGVLILGVTAVLVGTATGRESYHAPATGTVAFHTGGRSGAVHAVVTPGTLGPERVSLSVTDSHGSPYTPTQVSAALSLPADGVGPLAVPLVRESPGRYQSRPVPTGIAGTWNLVVTVRSSAFDETTVTIPFAIR